MIFIPSFSFTYKKNDFENILPVDMMVNLKKKKFFLYFHENIFIEQKRSICTISVRNFKNPVLTKQYIFPELITSVKINTFHVLFVFRKKIFILDRSTFEKKYVLENIFSNECIDSIDSQHILFPSPSNHLYRLNIVDHSKMLLPKFLWSMSSKPMKGLCILGEKMIVYNHSLFHFCKVKNGEILYTWDLNLINSVCPLQNKKQFFIGGVSLLLFSVGKYFISKKKFRLPLEASVIQIKQMDQSHIICSLKKDTHDMITIYDFQKNQKKYQYSHFLPYIFTPNLYLYRNYILFQSCDTIYIFTNPFLLQDMEHFQWIIREKQNEKLFHCHDIENFIKSFLFF